MSAEKLSFAVEPTAPAGTVFLGFSWALVVVAVAAGVIYHVGWLPVARWLCEETQIATVLMFVAGAFMLGISGALAEPKRSVRVLAALLISLAAAGAVSSCLVAGHTDKSVPAQQLSTESTCAKGAGVTGSQAP